MTRKRLTYRSSEYAATGCLVQGFMALFYIVAGFVSNNYLIDVFFNKSIPILATCAIAFFAAGLTVPVAIVVWILRLSGVL